MSQPCEQKDEIHNIKMKLDSRDLILTNMQVRQAEIQGDVSHIKTRLDNGMSHTIKDTHDILVSLKPTIEHHASIIKRIEDIGWLISRWAGTGIVVLVLAVVAWALSKGLKL